LIRLFTGLFRYVIQILNLLLNSYINSDNFILEKRATEGYEKKIGDQYQQDPTLGVTDVLSAIDNVLHRKCVLPAVIAYIYIVYDKTPKYLFEQAMAFLNYIIYQDTKANGHCRMTVSTVSAELKHYNHLPLQMGFLIGSSIASDFNRYIQIINILIFIT